MTLQSLIIVILLHLFAAAALVLVLGSLRAGRCCRRRRRDALIIAENCIIKQKSRRSQRPPLRAPRWPAPERGPIDAHTMAAVGLSSAAAAARSRTGASNDCADAQAMEDGHGNHYDVGVLNGDEVL